MITSELISAITKETGLSRNSVSEMLAEFPKVVVEEVSKGNKVKISKFGTFVKKNYGDKSVYNPKTGSKETIQSYERITCRIADALKKELQNNKES